MVAIITQDFKKQIIGRYPPDHQEYKKWKSFTDSMVKTLKQLTTALLLCSAGLTAMADPQSVNDAIYSETQADSGEVSQGLIMMALPGMIALASREAAKPKGWLKGMIRPTIP